jgi:hypothetical protein
MKTLKYLYFSLLVISVLNLFWLISMVIGLEIDTRRSGWDSTAGGAGMGQLVPIFIIILLFILANLLGLILLFVDKKRHTLKKFEKLLITFCLVILFLSVLIGSLFSYMDKPAHYEHQIPYSVIPPDSAF